MTRARHVTNRRFPLQKGVGQLRLQHPGPYECREGAVRVPAGMVRPPEKGLSAESELGKQADKRRGHIVTTKKRNLRRRHGFRGQPHEGGVDLLVCLVLGFEPRWRWGGRPNQHTRSLDLACQQLCDISRYRRPCVRACESGARSRASMRGRQLRLRLGSVARAVSVYFLI